MSAQDGIAAARPSSSTPADASSGASAAPARPSTPGMTREELAADVLRPHCPAPDMPALTARGLWGHLRTITRHKLLVTLYCFKVGLVRQGLLHDLSKYAPAEFWRGARYFQGDRSPNSAERAHRGVTEAWLHHKGRNRHHFEYWVDIRGNGDARMEGKPMPTRYVVEMLCDRIAASRVYQGAAYTDASPLEYFLREGSAGALPIHPATAALLQVMLERLARDGERATLGWVRRDIVRPKLVYVEGGRF